MRVSRSVCFSGLILGIVAVPYLIVAGASSGMEVLDGTPSVPAGDVSGPAPPLAVERSTAFLGMPLSFEANQGQVGPETSYLARGSGYRVFASPHEMSLALGSGSRIPGDAFSAARPVQGSTGLLSMAFAGAHPDARIEALDRLPGVVNYLVGPDPDAWVVDVPTFSGLAYRELYPGVDLYMWGDRRRMNYEFYVQTAVDHDVRSDQQRGGAGRSRALARHPQP